MNAIYSDILLEHSRNKKNNREIENPDYVERGHNPNCGDDLTLLLKEQDGIIEDASFIGYGCAISQASMSIMIDLVKGRSIIDSKRIVDIFLSMIRGEDIKEEDLYLLEDAFIFESLKDVPARIKCATLGWHCLNVIIEKKVEL